MTANQYDAIIIGGGHNRLVAAAYLQKPYYEVGTNARMEITVEHHRQHAPARVVKLPFYEPEWKKK